MKKRVLITFMFSGVCFGSENFSTMEAALTLCTFNQSAISKQKQPGGKSKTITFNCYVCFKTFHSQSDLSHHQGIHRKEEKLKKKSELRVIPHQNVVRSFQQQMVQCQFCQGMIGFSGLYNHQKSCEKSIVKKCLYNIQEIFFSAQQSKYKCSCCNKVLSYLNKLIKHFEREHQGHPAISTYMAAEALLEFGQALERILFPESKA